MVCTSAKNNALPKLAPDLKVSVDGVIVNYTASLKKPEEVTLVLIHGFAASLETWRERVLIITSDLVSGS